MRQLRIRDFVSGIRFTWRINRLLWRQKYELAERLCREAIQTVPRDPLYHESLAKTLWKQGKLEEAIQEYRITISLRRFAFSADRFDLIQLLLEAKHYEEAILESQKLLDPQVHRPSLLTRSLHPYMAYWRMAQAYIALGEYQHAKEALVKLLLFHKKGKAKAETLQSIAFCDSQLNRTQDFSG